MNDHKNLLHHIADWWQSRQERPHTANWSRWLPTPGNILFTLLMIGLLIFTQQTWANNGPESVNAPGPSATTVNYQGRLAAPDGTPKNGTFGMNFAIYDAASGGNLVWGPESHSAVPVTNGLFNVGLGSLTSGGIPTTVWNGDRYLQITVGGETLTPRELIRSVPIAGMALTIPDGAVTSNKLGLNHVTNYSETDVTTSSTTFVPLQQVTINLDKTSHVLLMWQSHASNNTVSCGAVNCGGDFWVFLDGVEYLPLRTSYDVTTNPGAIVPLNISGLIENLSSGSHTIEIRWKARSGGTVTNYSRSLSVIALGQ